MVAPFELNAIRRELNDLPLTAMEPPAIETRRENMENVYSQLVVEAKNSWKAWLGNYKSLISKFKWTTADLVDTSRVVASSMGLQELPGIPKKTLGKM